MILKHLCLYSILLATWPPLLWASNLDDNSLFRQCPASTTLLTHHAPPAFSEDAIDTTDISAEQVINSGKTTSVFSGNVLIERHLLRLQTDQATYSRDTQRVDISGNIHIDTESMALGANKGWLNLLNNEGEFNASTYYIPEAHLSGSTPVIRVTADNRTILTDTQFTTCPLNQPDWSLGASTLILDQNEATGTAKHTVFRLKGVPLLYFPWIQFPLGDERRSGFLIPSIGISSSRGLELAAPIYWNIAPNQDAIITPRYMRERGTMLATDYRYQTRSSQGVFNFEYLNNDAQFDEQAPDKILFDKQRYLIHFKNQSKITDNLSLSLLANTVSDDEYLRDMGSNIGVSNVSHLEKNANLKYTFDNWNAGLLTQSFETIDTTLTNRPYQRLPQITLRGKEELLEIDNGYLQGSLESEWVEFAHENAAKKQGSRFFAYPKLSLPIEGNAWFIKPTAGYYYSQYDITENDDKLDIEDRGLSVLSLDSGLFFEKDYASSSLIQTLEPRLYYLNVPFEDQAAIPPFDTSEQSFSFSSLFRENRFTGIDRIGDANQLTLALSSRMLNSDNGHELMNFSIGRIFYFDKQRVTLTDTADPADTSANASDIIAELGFNLNRWKARATTQWNRQTNEADKRNILLSYAASEKAVFNMGYRFFRDPRDDNLEQTDVSFAWPFARNYALLGRWNYSLTEQRNLQTLIGLEYESCCWALRLVSQRYITDDTEDRTNFMFQLVLKGFGGSANKKTTNSLKFAIPGYQPDF